MLLKDEFSKGGLNNYQITPMSKNIPNCDQLGVQTAAKMSNEV